MKRIIVDDLKILDAAVLRLYKVALATGSADAYRRLWVARQELWRAERRDHRT